MVVVTRPFVTLGRLLNASKNATPVLEAEAEIVCAVGIRNCLLPWDFSSRQIGDNILPPE
jgi:hypothetical protein